MGSTAALVSRVKPVGTVMCAKSTAKYVDGRVGIRFLKEYNRSEGGQSGEPLAIALVQQIENF